MEKALIYLNLAKEGDSFFEANYQKQRVANNMVSEAYHACENYLKYLIEQYDREESLEHTGAMYSDSLQTIVNYLMEYMHIQISDNKAYSIVQIDGFYRRTQYPGKDAVFADEGMIRKCHDAIAICRELVLEIEKSNRMQTAKRQKEENNGSAGIL